MGRSSKKEKEREGRAGHRSYISTDVHTRESEDSGLRSGRRNADSGIFRPANWFRIPARFSRTRRARAGIWSSAVRGEPVPIPAIANRCGGERRFNACKAV